MRSRFSLTGVVFELQLRGDAELESRRQRLLQPARGSLERHLRVLQACVEHQSRLLEDGEPPRMMDNRLHFPGARGQDRRSCDVAR